MANFEIFEARCATILINYNTFYIKKMTIIKRQDVQAVRAELTIATSYTVQDMLFPAIEAGNVAIFRALITAGMNIHNIWINPGRYEINVLDFALPNFYTLSGSLCLSLLLVLLGMSAKRNVHPIFEACRTIVLINFKILY